MKFEGRYMNKVIKLTNAYLEKLNLNEQLVMNLTDDHYHTFFGTIGGEMLMNKKVMDGVGHTFYQRILEDE